MFVLAEQADMTFVVGTRVWTARHSSVDGCEIPVPKDYEVLTKVQAVSPPRLRLGGIAGQAAVFRVGDDHRITNWAAGWRATRSRSRGPAAAA